MTRFDCNGYQVVIEDQQFTWRASWWCIVRVSLLHIFFISIPLVMSVAVFNDSSWDSIWVANVIAAIFFACSCWFIYRLIVFWKYGTKVFVLDLISGWFFLGDQPLCELCEIDCICADYHHGDGEGSDFWAISFRIPGGIWPVPHFYPGPHRNENLERFITSMSQFLNVRYSFQSNR